MVVKNAVFLLGDYSQHFVFSAHPFGPNHTVETCKNKSRLAAPREGEKLQADFFSRLIPGDTLGHLFEMLPNVYFFVKDDEGRFVRMNRALVQATGFKCEADVLGYTDADFFSPFLAHGYREEDRWIIAHNRAVPDKVWFVPNGKGVLTCYLCSKVPLRDEAGRVIGIAGVMRDAQSAGSTIGPYEDLKPALEYLHKHFNESITIETVAARVHLSASQFQRRFRALFQTSPMQYLLQLRIDSACQQLQRTDASIGTIAMDNGFYDQSAFCRQFQKRIGITPRRYRDRYGKHARWSLATDPISAPGAGGL
jgi:AraC-like DNA-binding protein